MAAVRRVRTALRALGALTLLAFGGCGGSAPRPSVLLITIDTLRADAVSAWGREAGTTPRLDALAASGVRFAAASTVTPLTLPAHASLLTGWRPARIGLTVNGVGRPTLPVATLAERLSRAGYATAAFVSSTVLDRRHGLDAGFALYDDELAAPGGPAAPLERRADVTVEHALTWDGWGRGPSFAWVHLFDPHSPYDAPGGRPGTDRAAYLDEVRYVDAEVGRLLDGVAAATRGPVLVVVTSDHGEGLGEHGEETHGLLLHESTVHVPLLMAWLDGGGGPGGEDGGDGDHGEDAERRSWPVRGSVREDSVSLLDVTPTLLALLGLPAVDEADGASLLAPAPGRALPLETRAPWFYYGFSSLVGVRRDTLKLVGAPGAVDPAWTLYDLQLDPAEQAGAVVQGHALERLVRPPDPEVEGAAVGDAAALAALGYVGAVAPPPSPAALPDPRGELALIVALDRANTALTLGDAAAALRDLDALDARWAEAPERLYLRGRTLAELGRLDEAATALARACELRPTAALLTEQGLVLLRLADRGQATVEAAIDCLERALALAPDEPRSISLRARADLAAGRREAARVRIEAALEARPQDAYLLAAQRDIARVMGAGERSEAPRR